jgi:hypothetical protein
VRRFTTIANNGSCLQNLRLEEAGMSIPAPRSSFKLYRVETREVKHGDK